MYLKDSILSRKKVLDDRSIDNESRQLTGYSSFFVVASTT
jgi:hypothetical protein